MRKIGQWVILILVAFVLTAGSAGAREKITMRVCLANGQSIYSVDILDGSYELKDGTTNLPLGQLEEGDRLTVKRAGGNLNLSINGEDDELPYSGPILVIPEDDDDLSVFSFRDTEYRDNLSIALDGTGLLAVNQVDLEHYLYGVVGKEIGVSSDEEALKAQAVVSRSYALSLRGTGLKYDLTANTGSQVYAGYSAETGFGGDKVIEAVDDTRREVIYYLGGGDKELIQACYHANGGGYTESSENVWNESIPYLRGVPSPEDDYALKYAREIGDDWPAQSYRWEKTMTFAEIDQAIRDYNKKTGGTINIGSFQSLKLYRLDRDGKTETVSGRVTRLELIGDEGKASVSREAIRSLFALKSTKFDVSQQSGGYALLDSSGQLHNLTDVKGLKVIGADNFLVDTDQASPLVAGASSNGKPSGGSEQVVFKGYGSGHGVGMSQWGARGMAVKGADYQEIIDHYYNGDRDDGKLIVERYD